MSKILILHFILFYPIDIFAQQIAIELDISCFSNVNNRINYKIDDRHIRVRFGHKLIRHCFKIKDNESSELEELIDSAFNNMDTLYSNAIIDGTMWKIKFTKNNKIKQVKLFDYFHPELDKIITILNRSLPERYKIPSTKTFFNSS